MDEMSRKILSGLAKRRPTPTASGDARRQSAERARAEGITNLRQQEASAAVDRLLSRAPSRVTATSAARKRTTARSRRRKRTAPDEYIEPTSTTLPGMEFVAPVRRPKKITPRKTSDYSDMFGPQYLIVGADVAAVKNLAQGSSEESAAIRKEEEDKKARRRAFTEKMEKFKRVEEMMRQKGELDSKKGREKLRRLRDRVQASEWVAVAEPVSAFESVAPPRRPPRMPTGAKKTASGSSGLLPPVRAQSLAQENKARKNRLLARLGVDTSADEPAPARRDARPASRGSSDHRRSIDRPDADRAADRRAAQRRERTREEAARERARACKRARYSDSEDESEDDRRRRSPVQKRRRVQPREYSDSESEYESESDDGGGMFKSSFAEVEEEEERSRALGRLEDRRELAKEKRRKEAKEDMKRRHGLI